MLQDAFNANKRKEEEKLAAPEFELPDPRFMQPASINFSFLMLPQLTRVNDNQNENHQYGETMNPEILQRAEDRPNAQEERDRF